MSENKKPSGLKFSPWWISGGVILIFVVLNILGGSSLQDPSKISSSKFDELLNSGQIEKVIIFNKNQAEAYLTAAALKAKANEKIAKDVFGNPNKGPHYIFDPGNDELFQKKLVDARAQKKIKDFDFQTKSDWSEFLIGLLPMIILIGVWLYLSLIHI